MRQEFLELIPKRYLCPYCGKWHKWNKEHELGYYDSDRNKAIFKCDNVPYGCNEGEYGIYFEHGRCFYSTYRMCRRAIQSINGNIRVFSIDESTDKPTVTFWVPFVAESDVGKDECSECRYKDRCLCVKLGDEGDKRHMIIPLGFEFEQSEYNKYVKPANKKQERHNDGKQMEKTTFWEQIYEHSPKENVEKVKKLVEKHKDTLKWAIPVASIYGAYRILNQKKSSITVENIGSECEKKLGISMECLEDKAVIKDLLKWGGLVAGAYATTKAISTIKNNAEEISVENLERGLDDLEGARKKLSFIQPKIDKLLPVAVSVIIVYLMTQKPAWFETWESKISKLVGGFSTKISIGWELSKLFVADKLHIDLDDDAEIQKFRRFACLAAILGIGVFLYGTKILKKKTAEDEENKVSDLMRQIISIMKKLMPTAFAGLGTFLVTKKVLDVDDDDWYFDSEEEEKDEEVDEEETPEEKSEKSDEESDVSSLE